jgi:type II secretory pathway pseudopilin PulG
MQQRYRGFFILDAIIGMILVTAMATALVVVVSRQSRASRRLAEQRAAVRDAEAVLAQLHSGELATKPDRGSKVSIRRLPPTGDITGFEWVEIEIQRGDAQTRMTGLVRHDLADEPEPKR